MKTCFPLCVALRAISTLAIVPGEIPTLAHVEDGSSGGDRLHRGKGERKTRVVSAAFTLAEKNGRWQPTPVFLPGESQGRASWWAAVYGVAQGWTRLK